MESHARGVDKLSKPIVHACDQSFPSGFANNTFNPKPKIKMANPLCKLFVESFDHYNSFYLRIGNDRSGNQQFKHGYIYGIAQ